MRKDNAKEDIAVDKFVIVSYQGQQFPGKVTAILDDGATVSTLTKCKTTGWRWPRAVDETV